MDLEELLREIQVKGSEDGPKAPREQQEPNPGQSIADFMKLDILDISRMANHSMYAQFEHDKGVQMHACFVHPGDSNSTVIVFGDESCIVITVSEDNLEHLNAIAEGQEKP